MNPIKIFYDKSIYKKIYEEIKISSVIIYIIFALLFLTFLYLHNPMKFINKYTDIIFLEQVLKLTPSIISYDDNIGLKFFDQNNSPIIKKEISFVKIDTTKEKFTLEDFKNSALIISSKNFVYRKRNNIEYFPIQNINMNFLIKNNYDSISIFRDNNMSRTFSLSSLSNILSRITLALKLAIYFSSFCFITFLFILSSALLASMYFYILKKKNRKLIFHRLIFSFYPTLYINIIVILLLKILNINNIYFIFEINSIIFFLYSLIITFNFLQGNQKQL